MVMNPGMHLSRRQSVSSEFERETKLVVLNFMGLVPASCPATADVYDTVRVDVSSEEEEEAEEDMRPRSHSDVPFCGSRHAYEQPGVTSCSVSNRVSQNGALNSQHCTELLDSKGIYTTEIVVDTCIEGVSGHSEVLSNSGKVCVDSIPASTCHQLPSNSADQSGMLQVPSSSRSPSPHDSASGFSLIERQSSLRSTTSSRRSSQRSASINVQQADVETLVNTHSLPPLVIPLRDEISREIEVLGQGHLDLDAAQGISVS